MTKEKTENARSHSNPSLNTFLEVETTLKDYDESALLPRPPHGQRRKVVALGAQLLVDFQESLLEGGARNAKVLGRLSEVNLDTIFVSGEYETHKGPLKDFLLGPLTQWASGGAGLAGPAIFVQLGDAAAADLLSS